VPFARRMRRKLSQTSIREKVLLLRAVATSAPTRTAASSRHERVEMMALRIGFACCMLAVVPRYLLAGYSASALAPGRAENEASIESLGDAFAPGRDQRVRGLMGSPRSARALDS
jgi:hypothetical protein